MSRRVCRTHIPVSSVQIGVPEAVLCKSGRLDEAGVAALFGAERKHFV